MFEQMIARVPEPWREVAELLAAPIAWIPRMQEALLTFFLDSPSPWMAGLKLVFLLFPVLLGVAAVWCTQLSLYTLPFRAGRVRFVSMMLLTWWDAARAVWMYWSGMVRFVGVAAGWVITLTRLVVRLGLEVLRQLVVMPFAMTGRMTQSYFQPGVPWIAFVMLLFWCVLEAAIFTYTLLPTVSEVLADLVGAEQTGRLTAPILYFFLFLLIMGSFACVHALVDAVKRREMKFIVQIVAVELFVMFFEVMFLYREIVDALTPWIAQQTGARLGLGFTLTVAVFGWIGIRGMTWFLFGQYGTAPLLAFISRRPIMDDETAPAPSVSEPVPMPAWWREPLADFKEEVEWLHAKSEELLEYLALPVIHLLAAGLNFGMVLIASRPVFNLPFKALKEVTEARDQLAAAHLKASKQASL
jgi:hypothetical protein